MKCNDTMRANCKGYKFYWIEISELSDKFNFKKCGTDLRLCGGVLGLGGVRSLKSFMFLSPSLGGVLGLNGTVTSVPSLPVGEVFVCGGVF